MQGHQAQTSSEGGQELIQLSEPHKDDVSRDSVLLCREEACPSLPSPEMFEPGVCNKRPPATAPTCRAAQPPLLPCLLTSLVNVFALQTAGRTHLPL